jgi:NADH dehydrogenase
MKILVTGATGFIGRSLTRQLVEAGHKVRILLRPSPVTPSLPFGVPVEVAVTGLADVRGLRAALSGVEVIYHLASGEAEGGRANLQAVDIDGTRNLMEAAARSSVRRVFFLSHLDADRASAFPVLKAKGIAEEYIRRAGLPFTILRGSILFGPGDTFTSGLAMLLALSPGVIPLPGRGETLVQPLWVEDLTTCLVWALENPETVDSTIEVGGIETISLREVVETIMSITRQPRLIIPTGNTGLRLLTASLEATFPHFPTSVFWLDYLTVNRTCPMDAIPQVFGLMPARFKTRLDHLKGMRWGREAFRRLFSRRR